MEESRDFERWHPRGQGLALGVPFERSFLQFASVCRSKLVPWLEGWGAVLPFLHLSSVLTQAREHGVMDLGEKEPGFLLSWTHKLPYFPLGSALLS